MGGLGLVAGKNALVQRNGTTGDIELTVQDALASTTALTRHGQTWFGGSCRTDGNSRLLVQKYVHAD